MAGGEARSIARDRVRDQPDFDLKFLSAACPQMAKGLEVRLALLPDKTRGLYLDVLAHLVRGARAGWEKRLDDFAEESRARFRTNRRLIENQLKRRREFCGVPVERISLLLRLLEEAAIESPDEELMRTFGFAYARLVHILGFFIRTESGFSFVPER